MAEELKVVEAEGMVELCLNRPETKNALNLAMYARMADVLEDIPSRQDIRSVLIYGEGAAFTSGNDLGDFASASQPYDATHPLIRFMQALAFCPIPVVAAVDGVAVGIGTTLLLHCDLVYASDAAVFRLPFVNLGLVPEYASSLLLPKLVGHVKAAELLMLGEKFGANAALDYGIINQKVENPLERAREQCVKLNAQAPEAIRITKGLLKAPLKEEVAAVMQTEGELFTQRLKTAEFSEAVSAFFEKRTANFSQAK